MSYSMIQRQECSICNDKENPVGIFKKESLQRGVFEEQKGTILKCKHAFHNFCILKYFAEGQTNCPKCLIEEEQIDRVLTINDEFIPKRESFYPDSQQGQVCTICFDDDDLVGDFEKTSLQKGTFHEQKGTILKCMHAFHDVCIRKHFYELNKSCPTCRTEVDEKDRLFDLTKDPTSTANFEHYNERTESGANNKFVFSGSNISDEKKEFYLKNAEKIRNGTLPGLIPINQETFTINTNPSS